MDVYADIARMREEGHEGALVVVTDVQGHAPQVVGAKMVVRPDGSITGTIGGGRVEHVVIEQALAALEEGRPATATFNLKAELGMCCGGRMSVYIEPVVLARRVVLFGAGHVAHATARVCAMCDLHVVVVDERPDWNSAERFPAPVQRAVEPHGDFLDRFAFRPSDMVVVTTHNHDHDREILGRVLRALPEDAEARPYIGMIGSTQKVRKTMKRLRVEGFTQEELDRAHAPIGLDILAETPAEIGVAIAGQLIRHRRAPTSTKTTRGAPVRLLSEAS